jgi:hypothetical protein
MDLNTIRAWVAKEGVVCSLQADDTERRALTSLVRAGRATSTPSKCGTLACRHYTTRDA